MHDESLCITNFIHTSRFVDEQLPEDEEITIEQVIQNIFSLNYIVDIPPTVLNDALSYLNKIQPLKKKSKE